jgi:hypothetical protein
VTSSVEEFPPLSSAMVLALPFQTQQTAFRCSIEPVTLLEAWKVVQKVVVSCFFPSTKLLPFKNWKYWENDMLKCMHFGFSIYFFEKVVIIQE